MGAVHGAILGLNADVLALYRAADGVAKLDQPLILCLLLGLLNKLGDEDAVVSARLDVKKALHVLDGLLVDLCVPESNAHVVSLWLSVSEDDGVVEEAPHVLGLDVGEEDVRVDGEDNSEAKSFPGKTVDDP